MLIDILLIEITKNSFLNICLISVRPASWELTGYDAPVLEGTVVNLLCRVKGARPAASITWYNGTTAVSPQPPSNLAVQVIILM